MSITKEDFRKLAKSLRLEVLPEEEQEMYDRINSEIESAEWITEFDTTGVEPMVSPYELPLQTAEDEVSDGDKVDEVLANAKEKLYNYFVVPKVIKNKSSK